VAGIPQDKGLLPERVAQRPASQETRARVNALERRGHVFELFRRRGQETFRPHKKELDSFGVREDRRVASRARAKI